MWSNLFAENRWTQTSEFTTLSPVSKIPLEMWYCLPNLSWVQRNWLKPPKYCLPFVGLNYLTELPDSANLLPPEPLSQRQNHEYLRTAQLVEQSHWKLDRAAEYLRTLVSDSARGSADAWKVTVIRWIFEDAGTRDSL